MDPAAVAGLEAPEILPIAVLDVGPRVARALGCGPIEGRDGIERLGLRMFREWPVGRGRASDVDSGPVLFGAGMAATGIGLAAARSVGDAETACDIETLAEFFGCPLQTGGERRILLGQLAVGDGFLAYGRSIPLPAGVPTPSGATRVAAAWPFHLVCAVAWVLLVWRLVRLWRLRLRGGR